MDVSRIDVFLPTPIINPIWMGINGTLFLSAQNAPLPLSATLRLYSKHLKIIHSFIYDMARNMLLKLFNKSLIDKRTHIY